MSGSRFIWGMSGWGEGSPKNKSRSLDSATRAEKHSGPFILPKNRERFTAPLQGAGELWRSTQDCAPLVLGYYPSAPTGRLWVL